MPTTCAKLAAVLTSVLAVAAIAAPQASSSSLGSTKAEVCGIEPGEGAYSFIRVWNMGCARGHDVAANAYVRFCPPSEDCVTTPGGDYIKGNVSFNGWKCRVKLGYEFSRIRCEKPGKRLVEEAAA